MSGEMSVWILQGEYKYTHWGPKVFKEDNPLQDFYLVLEMYKLHIISVLSLILKG